MNRRVPEGENIGEALSLFNLDTSPLFAVFLFVIVPLPPDAVQVRSPLGDDFDDAADRMASGGAPSRVHGRQAHEGKSVRSTLPPPSAHGGFLHLACR